MVGAFLTSEGAAAAAALEQHCFDEVDDPFEPAIAVPPGGVFAADPTATPPFAELFAAGGFPGGATSAPMLIFHGALDPDVPLAVSDALLAQLCAAGQIVERRVGVDEYPRSARATPTPTDSTGSPVCSPEPSPHVELPCLIIECRDAPRSTECRARIVAIRVLKRSP